MISLAKIVFHRNRRNIARLWLKLHPQVRIIGITGSYGKTSTAKAIRAVLKESFETIITDTSLDTIYNLPITLLKIGPKTQVAILEYGIDRKGEMDEHLKLVKPEIAVITGITPVHSEENMLGSLDGIIEEKSKLLRALPDDGRAILNFDNPWVAKMAQEAPGPITTYGTKKSFDFYYDNVEVSKKGTSFNVYFKKNNRVARQKIQLRLLGEHFAQGAMAALAVADSLGIDINQACRALERLAPLPGRMSLEKGPDNSHLINDSLRANPASTMAGLKTLANFKHQGPRIAVLGEMGELGQYQDREHYRVGQLAGQLKNINYLITLGPATKKIVQGAISAGMNKKNIFYTKSHQETAEVLKTLLKPNTLWYLKGSLLKHMERILIILRGKTVACQRISCHNYYHCLKCKELNPNTKNTNQQ
ncbi:MAG: UDP-N-acetylmuramoyl-tripeptide--D-alanyl-D-alanine ligase [Candidatus Shapirobacteria bacterium]|nr:UDP-N-acetylmuramoyl-tripeptide--D-alanyl-D-alanine ligase [Candidatus Shapirobacteria bacterium]MDD5073966.1 UDP-N-acetylmuramoyl-tripeptide--D-alanyl-D-alanine ligase [Candidatus Shapirobacteria bacterium]MDD5481674.1 UDP-N-acetylmuramoyl-tripeptide--D-alanyl-D-alanine ligase [Candidatus Shapirobacteria bacterium]